MDKIKTNKIISFFIISFWQLCPLWRRQLFSKLAYRWLSTLLDRFRSYRIWFRPLWTPFRYRHQRVLRSSVGEWRSFCSGFLRSLVCHLVWDWVWSRWFSEWVSGTSPCFAFCWVFFSFWLGGVRAGPFLA